MSNKYLKTSTSTKTNDSRESITPPKTSRALKGKKVEFPCF
jgi:hypothetical protein